MGMPSIASDVSISTPLPAPDSASVTVPNEGKLRLLKWRMRKPKRSEIGVHYSRPLAIQIVNLMPSLGNWLFDFIECAFTAGRLEAGEVPTRMSQWIKRIMIAV